MEVVGLVRIVILFLALFLSLQIQVAFSILGDG